ncbi:MAG: HAMP domain-containing histidine kinase [Clostridia bacterium]|nr:HAMP domain-containing histidine kinase [Clostridia bacterium]
MNKATNKSSVESIRWKLAVYLAFFIALVLLVVWIFQVYLLNVFYEHIKRKELVTAAEELMQSLETDSDELNALAYNLAVDCTMSVVVYRIEDGKAESLVNVDATGQTGMFLSDEVLKKYYYLAQKNSGSYTGEFTFGGSEVQGQRFPFFSNDSDDGHGVAVQSGNIRLMSVYLVEGENGSSHLILLNAGLQPLDSTVQILQTQFIWIAYILLLLAGFVVFLLYRRISAPLIRMNESAKKLALGKYDVEFSGEGYLETRELADTLNYASHELSRLDRLQKELIANISHDLRTPLTMIKGYSEVMRDIPGENTPENIQIVIDETTRLSELVNDLLDLSRIQSGTRKAEMQVLDLSAALKETIKRYDTFVRHRGYKITVEIDQEAWIYADRGMILQVLYNLINNAINYTGSDLKVTVSQTVIDGKSVRINVTDTGEGISPDQMPLIWNRYYKVDKVHRRAMIGTGLGLSIVKEILELHHAAYGINSKSGNGSTFWFEIPIIPTPMPSLDSVNTED